MRTVGRWFFLIVGLLLTYGGVWALFGGYLSHAFAAPDEATGGATTAIVVGAVLLVVGWAMGMASFPTFTVLVGAGIAALAILSGAALAVIAGVLSRIQPVGFDPDRATHDTWIAAIACFAIAIALGVTFAAWLRRRGSHPAVHHLQCVVAVGYGSVLFLTGLGSVVQSAVGMVQTGGLNGDLGRVMGLAGSSVLIIGPGAVLLWHGAGALTRVGSTYFRPPPVFVPLLAAVLAIGLGALFIQAHAAVQLVPLAHAVAVVAPGLAILALVSTRARRAGDAARSTWRQLLLMVAYGAVVAATIAGLVNTFALFASLVVYLTTHGAFDAIGTRDEFFETLRRVEYLLGESGLLSVLLIVFAVLGPLNEEFWKGLGVRLLKRDRPTRYQAFLWGLASGVGFGMVEANEYSLSAFARSPYRWWDTILLRGAASSLHALASGTVGIAWFYAFQGRRLRFLALYFTAVGLHGSWNALNVLTAARVLPWFKTFSNHDLEIVLEVLTALITVPILVMLRLLSRSLADEDEPPAAPVRAAA